MNKLVEALAKINDDYRVIEALQALWPEGRLDLICIIQKDARGDVKEAFRIEAWPRNSHKGKALGKQYPYMYGKKAREDADTIHGAWKHVIEDIPLCKWKRKPSGSLNKKVRRLLADLDAATYNTSEAAALNMPKGSTVIIRYRTPSKTHYEDRFRRVRLSLTPVKYDNPKRGDQAKGDGENVSLAAFQMRREFERINAQYKYAEEEAKRKAENDAYHKRKDSINAALQRAEPGDLIIQAEGEKPTLILVEKLSGAGPVKAWPLDPRQGTFLKFNFHSIHRTPRIAPMSPVVRKLLLAYAGVREKVTDHAIVVRGPDGRVTLRVGKGEFGFYWRREALRLDLRDFFPFRLTFLG